MSSLNADVSPYVLYDSAAVVTIKNIINANNAPEVIADPETDDNGGASSKYIIRTITLADDITATSLRVMFQENIQNGTEFQVFYKVKSDEDSDVFDDKLWVEMTRTGIAKVNASLTDYVDVEYKTDNISYTVGSANYNSFKSFAIKLVMYSTNPAFTPTAKNLRVIALA